MEDRTASLYRGSGPERPADTPFSLGLCQMAFWFFLAIAAYVYICSRRFRFIFPWAGVLGLLGIRPRRTGRSFVDTKKTSTATSRRAICDYKPR